MKRPLKSNKSATNEENEGASCSKIGSTHINNRLLDTRNTDCNINPQINAYEPEAKYGSTNDTTLKPVNDIMDNNSSIETEKKSNEEPKEDNNCDDTFMTIALLMAKRSKDPVTKVGACVVSSDNKILGTGYNEMPTGCSNVVDFPWDKNKKDRLKDKRTYVCHAELNAVLNTNSISLQNCIIYVSLFPCNECAKIIIQSGIKNVVYCEYRNEKQKNQIENIMSEKMFEASDVKFRHYVPKQNIIIHELKTVRESVKLQINAVEPEAQTCSTNETTRKPKEDKSWDDLFMATAFLMAKRSNDPIKKTGACIVSSDKKIVGSRYNTIFSNDDLYYVCHAEMNAVLNKNSISLQNCIIYVSHFPCNECAKIIIQSGIKEVVYCKNKYEDEASKKMFKASGVHFRDYIPEQDIITIELKTAQEPVKLQINAVEPKAQTVSTNGTTRKPKVDISWDDLFMATAFLMAKRSNDPVNKIGAWIVSSDDKKIVGSGYNTIFSNDDVYYVCHAEMNTVLNKNPISLKNCIIYVSHFPCNECAKIIIQSGIKEVVYCKNEDENEASKNMFNASGVEFRPYNPKQDIITLEFR